MDGDGNLRRLVSWVVNCVAEGCIAVEDARLEKLFEAIREGFGAS